MDLRQGLQALAIAVLGLTGLGCASPPRAPEAASSGPTRPSPAYIDSLISIAERDREQSAEATEPDAVPEVDPVRIEPIRGFERDFFPLAPGLVWTYEVVPSRATQFVMADSLYPEQFEIRVLHAERIGGVEYHLVEEYFPLIREVVAMPVRSVDDVLVSRDGSQEFSVVDLRHTYSNYPDDLAYLGLQDAPFGYARSVVVEGNRAIARWQWLNDVPRREVYERGIGKTEVTLSSQIYGDVTWRLVSVERRE
ncbi:MAG: hypothetical protein AAGG50_11190 [Bacteroidota bacterium]